MNALLSDPRRERNQAIGEVLAFFYTVAGKPPRMKYVRSYQTADVRKLPYLWKGSVSNIREGCQANAQRPEVIPETDAELADLLMYARPTLRQHGYLLSPGTIQEQSIVYVRVRPKNYQPAYGRKNLA